MSRSAKRPKRIALSGYYGFDNAGDEAVLAGLIKALRAPQGGNDASLEITALSIDPASTTRDHGIPAAHRYKAGPLLRAIAGCDLLASGGGSLLQDVTSRHSIFYYLAVVRIAQLLGKKTMFIAQGIGPLNLPRSRKLTAAVARRCDALTVRDQASADLLREIGVKRPEITVTADPALLLGKPDTAPRDSGIGYSLREWHSAKADLSTQIARSLPENAGKISSMRMSPSDAGVHRDLERELASVRPTIVIDRAVEQRSDRTLLFGLDCYAARSEMVIGMRLHALILAAANGVPSVALSYDPKVGAFMQQTGQADAVFDICGDEPSELPALITRVWQERQARTERLLTLLPTLRATARRNGEIAIELIHA